MKKVFILLILAASLLFIAACSESELSTEAENINADNIRVKTVLGLNEEIYLSVFKSDNENCTVYYKSADETEYTTLDKELMLDGGDSYNCYILGLKKGIYDVKIEQGEGENISRTTINGIDVEKQDRSGYAHFNATEGVGAYNNDGTVKEGAKIIYLTNENKNTVTLDINGTTYTGLVDILKASEQLENPLIIRVLDRITTNQWLDTEAESRLPESADAIDGHFDNMFSTEYGENLANLPVIVYASSLGKRFEYVTTPSGISLLQTAEETETDNSCFLNLIEINNASNITIEGVGSDAGFYQFGIAFHYSDSIEVRNLTIEGYPDDGLGFFGYGDFTLHGRYWVHHNTFNRGYGVWNDSSGDGTVDFADVNHTTVAYNKFYQTDHTMLLSGWEYDSCLNFTFHHNYYLEVEQRLPLSRNSNIHNYNNFYEDCARGLSPRTSTYVFGEENHFLRCAQPYYVSASGGESWGAIKSFNEIYEDCGKIDKATVVTDREQYVENTCTHEGKTDYTRFDIDPELFYYDAENKRTDVEIMLKAEDVGEFVKVYAGAGVFARMDFPTKAN